MNKSLALILDQFKKEVFVKFPDEVIGMTLFGSQARGNDRNDSDVDVLIVTKNSSWQLADKIGEIAYEILLSRGVYISTKVVGLKHYDYLQKMKAPFIENVLKEGISL